MKTIAAIDRNWGIGRANELLFRLPDDMKHFREITTGKVVVMGLNTLRSFPDGAPLKNRAANIVLSDIELPAQPGLTVCRSVGELKAEIEKYPADDVFIIGGGMMYSRFIDSCSQAYITKTDADGGATVFFPNLDERENWVCTEISEPQITNGYTIRFCTYKNTAVRPL